MRHLIGLVLALHGEPAWADFDPNVGRVVFDDAIASTTLDDQASLAELGVVSVLDAFGGPAPFDPRLLIRDPDLSIEGWGYLDLTSVSGVVIGLESVADRLRDKRIEVKAWLRPQGSIPIIDLIYSNVAFGAGSEELFNAHTARLFPTGRATSDGWREVSTGPIDFSVHRRFEARAIRILDQRFVETSYFGLASNYEGGTIVDGLGIYDYGQRAVPDFACTLISEGSMCGSMGACFMGRCADAAVVLGNVPRDPGVRRDYLGALAHRMGIVLGGRYPLAQIASFEQRLMELVDESSFAEYWSQYHRAFDDLGDGHLSSPPITTPPGFGNGACVYQGDADLAGVNLVAPLVFERDGNHPVGAQLSVGDAILIADGLPVSDWMQLADRHLRYGGDPRGRDFITASQILGAGLLTGAVLEIHRPGLMQTVLLDFAALTEPFFNGDRLEWRTQSLTCDFRFERDVPNAGREYDFVGHSDRDGIRTILINGVSGSFEFVEGVRAATAGNIPLVILDERTGHGGTFDGVSAVLEPFLSESTNPIASLVPQIVPEVDAQAHGKLLECQMNGVEACGNYFAIPMAAGLTARGTAASARIAILNAYDVSGNDYLPRALVDRPTGETRVFAPVPTYGAFGPILYLPRILEELYGGTAQLHDTLFLWESGFNLDFATGHGVEPDVVIRQKQTDLMSGRDTVLEAARAWLLSGGN